MTPLLLLRLISDNWKCPKDLTSPQIKHSTFVFIAPHFQHLHHLVTLWLFLDFSRVLAISCSSSKQTLFTFKLTGSYWSPTKAILLKSLLFIFSKISVVSKYTSENLWTELTDRIVKKNTFFNERELFWFHIQAYAFTMSFIHKLEVSNLRNTSMFS